MASFKVLDFGLAKVLEGDSATTDLSQSPTLIKGTQAGVILGRPWQPLCAQTPIGTSYEPHMACERLLEEYLPRKDAKTQRKVSKHGNALRLCALA